GGTRARSGRRTARTTRRGRPCGHEPRASAQGHREVRVPRATRRGGGEAGGSATSAGSLHLAAGTGVLTVRNLRILEHARLAVTTARVGERAQPMKTRLAWPTCALLIIACDHGSPGPGAPGEATDSATTDGGGPTSTASTQ